MVILTQIQVSYFGAKLSRIGRYASVIKECDTNKGQTADQYSTSVKLSRIWKEVFFLGLGPWNLLFLVALFRVVTFLYTLQIETDLCSQYLSWYHVHLSGCLLLCLFEFFV